MPFGTQKNSFTIIKQYKVLQSKQHSNKFYKKFIDKGFYNNYNQNKNMNNYHWFNNIFSPITSQKIKIPFL